MTLTRKQATRRKGCLRKNHNKFSDVIIICSIENGHHVQVDRINAILHRWANEQTLFITTIYIGINHEDDKTDISQEALWRKKRIAQNIIEKIDHQGTYWNDPLEFLSFLLTSDLEHHVTSSAALKVLLSRWFHSWTSFSQMTCQWKCILIYNRFEIQPANQIKET